MEWWGQEPENAAGFEATGKEGDGEEMGFSFKKNVWDVSCLPELQFPMIKWKRSHPSLISLKGSMSEYIVINKSYIHIYYY